MRIIGLLILGGVMLYFFIDTANNIGFVETFKMWVFAIGMTALFVVGAYMIAGGN